MSNETSKDERNLRCKQALESLIKSFKDPDFPTMVQKAVMVPKDAPSSKWSMRNRLLMVHAQTGDARGYRQWADKYRHPKKGSHAFYILGPRRFKKKVVNEETGEETESYRMAGFRMIPVFRYEDTEGEPIDEYEPRELPPLYDLAERNGIAVDFGPTVNGEYGSVAVPNAKMHLSTDDPTTYFHELVHYYDLRNRDDRIDGQDPIQETVAQLGACVLAQMYNIEARQYTWNYIKHYTGDRIEDVCLKVIDRTADAISNIIQDAEEQAPIPQAA